MYGYIHPKRASQISGPPPDRIEIVAETDSDRETLRRMLLAMGAGGKVILKNPGLPDREVTFGTSLFMDHWR